MNKDEAKEELNEYLHNKKYVEVKQQEIEALEERINKVTATYTDMPKGGAGSKEDLIAAKLDLEREVYSYLTAIINKQAIIERTIRSLKQPYRNILDFRFISGMSLMEVAVAENYSYRQCKRLLNEAYEIYAEMRNK